jgi:N-acetylmuramoyl-L-alanine amidase
MKIIKLIILLFTISLIFSFKENSNMNKFVVIIDAGHGGYDSGTIGYGGIKEKDINLDIALVTKYLLEKYDKNIHVILTRNKDVFVSLKKRTDIANYFNADLFISIHCDYNPNKNAKGVGIFLEKNLKSKNYNVKMYKKSLKYALLLNKTLTGKLNLKSRGIQFENFHVLRNTLKKMPSLLLEVGFISNKEEAEYFESKGKIGISYSLSQSIIKYKNG